MTVPGCNYQTSPYFAIPLPEGVPGGGVPGLGCGLGEGYLPNSMVPPGTPGGGGWWDFLQQQINLWSGVGRQLLLQREIPRGVYTRTGPGGTITYVQPTGSQGSIFGGAEAGATGLGSVPIYLLVAGVLIVLVVAGRRK